MTSGLAGPATSGTERASRSRRSSSRRSRTSSTTTGATRPANRRGGAYRRSRRSRPSTTTSRSWRWSRTRTTANSSPPRPAEAPCGRTPAPLWVGTFNYNLSEQTVRVREAANSAIAEVLAKAGLGRFMKFTFRTANASHPVGGCRMADSQDLGVVDHQNEVFDYPGLFCMDSSSIPTSLGVNPSLTISAVAERACQLLIDRSADYGLPAKPAGFAAGTPGVHLGAHTEPVRRTSDKPIDEQGPLLRNCALVARPCTKRRADQGICTDH